MRNLMLLVEYILRVNKHVTVDALAEFLAPMGDEAKEIPMTVGEQLIEQGRQEGIQKGELRAKRSMARKLLAKGMPPTEVAELTELPPEEVQSLTH